MPTPQDTHTHKHTHKRTHKHRHTHKQTHKHTTHTHTHTDTQTDPQTHRHTDTQTHRHTDTQTHTYTHIYIHVHFAVLLFYGYQVILKKSMNYFLLNWLSIVDLNNEQFQFLSQQQISLNDHNLFLNNICYFNQEIQKGEVSLYHWPPVWLVWNQLYDNWQLLLLFAKQTYPNQSNWRSIVQWYFPL